MARYTGPRLRIVRRLGELPGLTSKVVKERKQHPPGHHGPNQKQQKKSQFSDYKIRLMEKQKLRFNYGINEKQLLNYVKEARRRKGSTGFFLMQLLEMRLDTIIFRLGLASTIPAARQLINHGHILVNNKKVNIPSFICQVNDQISVRDNSKSRNLVKKSLANPRFSRLPEHLELNKKSLNATINSNVTKENLSFKVNSLLIVEYYARLI